ncbi:MAG: hypothetical protein WBI17_11990 [Clostridiaceae bacterium]
MPKFMEIIEKSRSIDSLPSLKSIYKKVNKKITEGEYTSDELIAVDEAFAEGLTIKIEDGTEVQLIKDITCAGHSYHEKKDTFAYRIGEDRFLCLTCHRTCRKFDEIPENMMFPLEWSLSDAEFFIKNSYPWKFAKIIADANDFTQLPKISDLLEELRELELLNECSFDAEKKAMENSFLEGTTIMIGGGSKVKLAFGKRCVLHRFNTPYIKYSYEIGENEYLCGICLNKGAEHKDMVSLHPLIHEELLFPMDWTRSGIDLWLENVERRLEALSDAKNNS